MERVPMTTVVWAAWSSERAVDHGAGGMGLFSFTFVATWPVVV